MKHSGIVSNYLALLGTRMRDRVTGFQGTVSTVGFDLYGCIQAVLSPSVGGDGKIMDGAWFDVSRLEPVPNQPRVMDAPDYVLAQQPEGIAAGLHGPAEKPAGRRA